jgi:hypothetical protein
MALGYTYSGVMKMMSPSWCDGSTLERILSNPLARCGARSLHFEQRLRQKARVRIERYPHGRGVRC